MGLFPQVKHLRPATGSRLSRTSGSTMTYQRFVEIGRIVLVNDGPCNGKLAVVVDVVDNNRALVDGPETGVPRQALAFKKMSLTNFVIRVAPFARTRTVSKAWKKSDIQKKWDATSWAKKLAA